MIRTLTPRSLRIAKTRMLGLLPGEVGLHNRLRYRWLSRKDPEPIFAQAQSETKGLVAIDLGANYGKYTALLAESASKVYAFEPDPATLDILRKNVGDRRNVEVRPEAAGTSEDTLKLYRLNVEEASSDVVASEASTLVKRKGILPVVESGIEVRVIDFPDFLLALEGEVGILKIDIEGAEIALLERMLETGAIMRCRYVFVETHERLYPEHRAPLDALIRATCPKALRLRFPSATFIPYVSLDWR